MHRYSEGIHYCPFCKREKPERGNPWCGRCGYVEKGHLIRISRGATIRFVPEWKVTDADGNTHIVPAIKVGMRMFHYGEEGMYFED